MARILPSRENQEDEDFWVHGSGQVLSGKNPLSPKLSDPSYRWSKTHASHAKYGGMSRSNRVKTENLSGAGSGDGVRLENNLPRCRVDNCKWKSNIYRQIEDGRISLTTAPGRGRRAWSY